MTTYLEDIEYNELGQRTKVEYGNGTSSAYSYDPVMHRLTDLVTQNEEGKTFQRLHYDYDEGGNIVKRENNDFVTTDEVSRSATQSYDYDDMNRLIRSSGSFNHETWNPFWDKRINNYTTDISYSETGNILTKVQNNTGYFEDEDETVTIDETTYDYTYGYDTWQPHAVTSAGPKSFSYDLNGNMTSMVDSEKGLTRSVTWNNENRITKTQDRYAARTVTTDYGYDAAGTRVRKSGIYGTTLYVNNGYTIKDGELEGVHVFAGNTRLVSKMILHERKDGTDVESVAGTWYYHADHLGSSSVVTDRDGDFYEQIEYFPYGETWVHNKSSEEMTGVPYKFTGKEQDVETGLYYHGARSRDPRVGGWYSVDPILNEYLPTGDKDHDSNLPGMGGVFNSVNLNLYHYGGLNPIILLDPDGNYVISRLEFGDYKSDYSIHFYGTDERMFMSIFKLGPGGSFWAHYLSKNNILGEVYHDSQFSTQGTVTSVGLAISGLKASPGLSSLLQGLDWALSLQSDYDDAQMDKYRQEFIQEAGLNDPKYLRSKNKKYLKGLMDNIDSDIVFYKKTIEGTKKDEGFAKYAQGRSEAYKNFIPKLQEYWKNNYNKEDPR